jgi:hypothetical protein
MKRGSKKVVATRAKICGVMGLFWSLRVQRSSPKSYSAHDLNYHRYNRGCISQPSRQSLEVGLAAFYGSVGLVVAAVAPLHRDVAGSDSVQTRYESDDVTHPSFNFTWRTVVYRHLKAFPFSFNQKETLKSYVPI